MLGLQIKVWNDRKINAGDTWYPEITKAMEQAAVAVCLISADFLSSDFCVKEEVPFLLKKREQAGMLLIPILIRPCVWEFVPWLKTLQMLKCLYFILFSVILVQKRINKY